MDSFAIFQGASTDFQRATQICMHHLRATLIPSALQTQNSVMCLIPWPEEKHKGWDRHIPCALSTYILVRGDGNTHTNAIMTDGNNHYEGIRKEVELESKTRCVTPQGWWSRRASVCIWQSESDLKLKISPLTEKLLKNTSTEGIPWQFSGQALAFLLQGVMGSIPAQGTKNSNAVPMGKKNTYAYQYPGPIARDSSLICLIWGLGININSPHCDNVKLPLYCWKREGK